MYNDFISSKSLEGIFSKLALCGFALTIHGALIFFLNQPLSHCVSFTLIIVAVSRASAGGPTSQNKN
jgi:hypothetical protein